MFKIFNKKMMSILFFAILYLWVAVGCLLGMDRIIDIMDHAVLFWLATGCWFLIFIILLSLYDYYIEQNLSKQAPEFEPLVLLSSFQSGLFFFIKRIMHLFLISVPFIFIFFFLVPIVFAILSHLFGYSMKSFLLFFSRIDVQICVVGLLLLGYIFFDIKLSFVNHFLFADKESSILKAYLTSYRFCSWKYLKAVLSYGWSWYLLQFLWVLMLLVVPLRTWHFWIYLGFVVLIYVFFYPIKRQNENQYLKIILLKEKQG